MPKREDERYSSRSGVHPVYCTCVECTQRFLERKSRPSIYGMWRSFLSRFKPAPKDAETPAVHPAQCRCQSCEILRSLG